MRHAKTYRKLGRREGHYLATMRNLALSLIERERIRTTTPKAKELRRFVERLITYGKRGGLHGRRLAQAALGNKRIVRATGAPFDPIDKLIKTLVKRYSARSGGYTRIIKADFRPGDRADMSYIEFVDAVMTPPVENEPAKKQAKAKGKAASENPPKKKAKAA